MYKLYVQDESIGELKSMYKLWDEPTVRNSYVYLYPLRTE